MPLTPTPTGPVSVPMFRLAEMIADSAAFQTAAGLTPPDPDARDKLILGINGDKRIFLPSLRAEDGDYLSLVPRMPLAVVQMGDAWQRPVIGGGANPLLSIQQGQLAVSYFARDELPADRLASFVTADNLFGAIDHEILQYVSPVTEDDLAMSGSEIFLLPIHSSEIEDAQHAGAGYWRAIFTYSFN